MPIDSCPDSGRTLHGGGTTGGIPRKTMTAQPPLNELQPRRVCVIKPSALGDVVQALPVLTALRARWPNAHVAWVIKHSLSGLLENHPDLNQVITYDAVRRGPMRLATAWRLWRELRRGQFDLAIDLQGLARSGLITLATSAARRLGFANARERATLAYTDPIPVPDVEMNAVARYWIVAQALGVAGSVARPRLGITQRHRERAAELLGELPRPILAVHPGTLWDTKRLPVDHFVELARRAAAEFGASLVLIGGPADVERCETIAEQLDSPLHNLAGQTTILELAAISQQCDVFLSGDTGPMHLAAAVGTPVVAAFTCTSPLRAGPFGAGHRVAATRLKCAGSYLRVCPVMKCMKELSPDRIWPALAATLASVLDTHSSRNVA